MIETSRLRLRTWRQSDKPAFAAMSADAEVMHDLGGPIACEASDAKLDRYAAAFERDGIGRWVLEYDGAFIGYTGVMHRHEPIGEHYEIGWRLVRDAWGHGYATEAAKAALHDAFTRLKLTEVVSYTSPDNLRSQAVMVRAGLVRGPSRDFVADFGRGDWQGLMWVARPGR